MIHTHLYFQGEDGIKLPTIKDDAPATDDKKPPADDISVKSDDDAPCPSCRMHPGTNKVFPRCQKGEIKLCDDCYSMMPTEVKFNPWCGSCRTCFWGKIQVTLGGDSEENKKAICTERPCSGNDDIRVRCLPVEDSKYKFVRCPARVTTMAWWIGNEIDLYKSAEQGDYTFLDEFDLTDDDKMDIIAEYNSDR